jgi:hypothetical protein
VVVEVAAIVEVQLNRSADLVLLLLDIKVKKWQICKVQHFLELVTLHCQQELTLNDLLL